MTYLFDNKFLDEIEVTGETSDGLATRYVYLTGLKKGESHVSINDYVYRMPDDRQKLIEAIDSQIEFLASMKRVIK